MILLLEAMIDAADKAGVQIREIFINPRYAREWIHDQKLKIHLHIPKDGPFGTYRGVPIWLRESEKGDLFARVQALEEGKKVEKYLFL